MTEPGRPVKYSGGFYKIRKLQQEGQCSSSLMIQHVYFDIIIRKGASTDYQKRSNNSLRSRTSDI